MTMITIKSKEDDKTHVELVLCHHSQLYFRLWVHNEKLENGCVGSVIYSLDDALELFDKNCKVYELI